MDEERSNAVFFRLFLWAVFTVAVVVLVVSGGLSISAIHDAYGWAEAGFVAFALLAALAAAVVLVAVPGCPRE